MASQYLHGLPLRSKVGFRLTRGDVKPAQHSYPFEGKQTFSLLCTASGLPPMLLLAGGADQIVPEEQTRRFAEAAQRAGNEAEMARPRGRQGALRLAARSSRGCR